MDLAMGERVTLVDAIGATWRCVLAGRRVDGASAFSGGDLGRGVLWLMAEFYRIERGWYGDAELVPLTVAG